MADLIRSRSRRAGRRAGLPGALAVVGLIALLGPGTRTGAVAEPPGSPAEPLEQSGSETTETTATVPAPEPPTISYEVDRAPDEADDDVPPWYRAPVTFTFTCDDADSSVAICPIPAIFMADGRELVTAVAALDTEGHSTIAITPPINLDQTAPVVQLIGPADESVLPEPPLMTCEASDELSGVVRTCTVGGAAPLGGGRYTVTAEARDRAGNVTRSTLGYRLEPAPADGPIAVLENSGSAPITGVFLGFDINATDGSTTTDRTLTAPARPARPDHLGTFVIPAVGEVGSAGPLAPGGFACSAPLDPLVAGSRLVSDIVESNGVGFGGTLTALAGPIEVGAVVEFSGPIGDSGAVLAGRLTFVAAADSPCATVAGEE